MRGQEGLVNGLKVAGLVMPSAAVWASLCLSRSVQGVSMTLGHSLEQLWYFDCILVVAIGFFAALYVRVRSSDLVIKSVALWTVWSFACAFLVAGYYPTTLWIA